ncbi:MAG: hypothetical protein NWE94_05615 [Candidatus Bathyarchaeota archaeon]|nr:hypothetical protein [Candidatus Bathyarchaeota archaeon]
MRTKLFATAISLFLLIAVVSVAPTYGAGEGEWITKYKIEDSQTGQLLMEVDFARGINKTYAPILPGAELTVTFTVNVVVSGGTLRLSTSMLHSTVSSTFWNLVTANYTTNFVNYNPNSAAVEFNAVRGSFEMICTGKIKTYPASTVFPVPVSVVQLSSSAGDVLDNIKPNVVNAAMDEYLKLLEQKEEKLQSLKDSGVAAGYIELFENVIDQAKAEAAQGYVNNAVALLNALSVSNEPASSVMESLFLPLIVVLAAVAGAAGFMFLRARGKIKYVLLVLEDQIKDLEGLTMRASKIDRTLSSSLDSVKDRLKSLVGM